jgi:hypothetical protein
MIMLSLEVCDHEHCADILLNIAYLAGTAGLALASRLSENPNVSVLVLEAGIRYLLQVLIPFHYLISIIYSDEGNVQIQAPFLGPTLTPSTLTLSRPLSSS